MLNRLRRDEAGFALVTAIAILLVMSLLMVVVLATGNSAFNISEKGSRFTRTLGPAEAGANDAMTRLGENRLSTSPCPIGSALVCAGGGGEYQVDWEAGVTDGSVVVTSVGYLPSKADPKVTRKVQVTLEPEPKFTYALFSADTLELKNNQVVIGDVFSNSTVTIGTGAIVCGSVLNAAGGVDTQNGARIVKTYGICTGKDGKVWAGGTIDLHSTGYVEGDAIASAPSSVTCPPTPSTDYAITGGTVGGTATACGVITATAPVSSPNTRTDPPAAGSLPPFTFDINNYPGATCFAIDTATCSSDPSNHKTTAVSEFNSTVSKTNMKGTYIIWQKNPSQDTVVNLENLSLGGDLTVITNAPITLGNTATVTSTVPSTLVLVSTYIPPTGTTCTTNGGDCSIFGKNSVVFDGGSASNPNDGIAALLYTPGKMAFNNQTNGADGALYAGSMDIKNGFDVVYNSRIERVVGFGTGLVQTLWQELAV